MHDVFTDIEIGQIQVARTKDSYTIVIYGVLPTTEITKIQVADIARQPHRCNI